MLTEINHTTSDTIHGEYAGVSFVFVLLATCCPPAIIRRIISVIIAPIKRHSFGPISHISKKVGKFLPSFANFNPTSTIVTILLIVGISASVQHCSPNHEHGINFSLSCVSVFYGPRINPIATAGKLATITQRIAPYHKFCAALTTAKNTRNTSSLLSAMRRSISNHFKPSKSFTDKGYSSRHGIGSFNVKFSGGRSADTDARCVYYPQLQT